MRINVRKDLKRIVLILLVLTMFIGSANAIGVASDQKEFIAGIKEIYNPLNPTGLGVYEIQFVPECDGILTITSNNDRIDILSSCKPRNLYIQFLVPTGLAVYQPKQAYNQKTYQQRILQKRLSTTTDEKYNLTLTKPESLGRFYFKSDTSFKDDDIIVEDAADQTLKANLSTINVGTITTADRELYDSLQDLNLSNVDNRMYSNLQKRVNNIGLDDAAEKIYIVMNNIFISLNKLIGGK